MKKYFLTLLILGLSVLLFGCGTSTKETELTETPQTETTETDTEDTTAKAPDDGEMDAVFNEAYEVYQWFELDKLEIESDENGIVMYEIEENLCGKVTDSRVSSFEELSEIVHTYFSEDISNRLLTDGLYFEKDGVLYQLLADRGGDITRGEILSQGVTERTDNSVTYTVTVETYDPSVDAVTGSEEIPFLYENIDGKWVFTRFQSIY
ncbi:MAG: hypothetical protein ACI4QO_08035 [Clostridia bacterium]